MNFSSSDSSVQNLISALLKARVTGQPVSDDFAGQFDPTVEEAYEVQAAVARVIGPVGGFKVANKPDAPRIMAPIFSQDIKTSPAMIDVPRDEKIGIELEVGFRIEKPLPDKEAPDRRDAIARCLSVVPVIEIVRTRLPMNANPGLKLADNQINGGLVVGAPVAKWQAVSLGPVRAELAFGDEQILSGKAAVPGGNAFENFLVLEEILGDHCGGLQPGQIVITGSLNGLPYVQAGIDVRGSIDGLGQVSLRLKAAR